MRNSKVKLDFEQIVGKIKPLHAVNDVPYAGFAFGSAEKYIKKSQMEKSSFAFCLWIYGVLLNRWVFRYL